MKFFSRNVVSFACIFAVLTILFRTGLSYLLTEQLYFYVWLITGVYGTADFLAGWFFGKKEHEKIDWFNIGFRFHFITYVLFGIISEIWFALGYNAPTESPLALHLTLLIWGIAVFIHFVFFLITRKSSIKEIDKENTF